MRVAQLCYGLKGVAAFAGNLQLTDILVDSEDEILQTKVHDIFRMH